MVRRTRLATFAAALAAIAAVARGQTSLTLDGSVAGPRFDGVGAVSGGGATSVLLKDYPPAQRDQILDLLFKPNFGASMQTLLVEVGGDGNSTQGSEQSHMRSRTDENYSRGYEWWLMREAKRRNPALTLDACAWGAPSWIGDGQYWSQDMADYYVKWVKGLKDHHGLTLDAIGCRNERGAVTSWAKLFRKTLDANGLQSLPIHGFDSPGNEHLWNWIPELAKDKELQNAVALVGNHCLTDAPFPAEVRETIARLGKPIWNTEEHVYDDGSGAKKYVDEYDAALGALHLFNANFIERGATKIVNWYLVGSTYACEPYAEQPPAMIAREPWSGAYRVKPIVWSYAHYGQFTKVGWRYVPAGCAKLSGGGTVVSMRAGDAEDFSVIAETRGASSPQQITLRAAGGLSGKPLCVWRTTRDAAFTRQADVTPAADGAFTVTLEPNAIYSFSTTTGQQKGAFADVPAARPFPLPYFDDFDHYGDAAARGYLPRYTADIAGVFELADRRDGKGGCVRQVVTRKAQSWAPEWKPYTVIGDDQWTDYEVSADVHLEDGGWAGVMGRITGTGNGWDNNPEGYYCRLYADGGVQLYSASQRYKGSRDRQLAIGAAAGKWAWGKWHRVAMRFEGKTIRVSVDGEPVLSVDDADHARGLAGLITGGEGADRVGASFDDLLITPPGGARPDSATFAEKSPAIYAK